MNIERKKYIALKVWNLISSLQFFGSRWLWALPLIYRLFYHSTQKFFHAIIFHIIIIGIEDTNIKTKFVISGVILYQRMVYLKICRFNSVGQLVTISFLLVHLWHRGGHKLNCIRMDNISIWLIQSIVQSQHMLYLFPTKMEE